MGQIKIVYSLYKVGPINKNKYVLGAYCLPLQACICNSLGPAVYTKM